MSIGSRITELRKQKRLSQGQLASALDVSRQAVSKWENDQTSPDTLKLIQLSDVLDTQVEYLATGKLPSPSVVTVERIVDRVVEVEKPVYIEKTVEKPVVQYVEKPVLKRVRRIQYRIDPTSLVLVGFSCFVLGLMLGYIL